MFQGFAFSWAFRRAQQSFFHSYLCQDLLMLGFSSSQAFLISSCPLHSQLITHCHLPRKNLVEFTEFTSSLLIQYSFRLYLFLHAASFQSQVFYFALSDTLTTTFTDHSVIPFICFSLPFHLQDFLSSSPKQNKNISSE